MPVDAHAASALLDLLEAARAGGAATRELGFASLDLDRERRQGACEAVLAEGKEPGEVAAIVRALLQDARGSVLVTRADPAARAAVRDTHPGVREHARARCAWIPRELPAAVGRVAILSAGTSDAPAVHEARIRAELLGTSVTVREDVGVAGLHRLTAALDELAAADCVVVVAGRDAALASVVGGLVSAPVIAVPTSAGYGAALNGLTPLLAMLASCADGVAVVDIDDGFGAGTIAARIARAAGRGGRAGS
ncbi:MAG: nickel pincer cofactor biosynthesis protein LarB [Actinomycetota bacterium]|nr:nickel pincer cofactor biosynthesis protein LarB [Actinomycetota bacterium]